jgi:general secretion pathway protein M
MKAQLLLWWRDRNLREQRMLLVMFALLAVTILWLGIYRPVQDALSDAHARHQEAVIRLGDVQAQANALKAVQKSGLPTQLAPLLPIVTESATDAGFANATIAPQGERRVSVSIPSARPAPVLAWLAALEAQGIVVERLSARANADPTLAIDVTLAGGG